MADSKLPPIRSIVTDDELGGFRVTIPPSDDEACLSGCGVAVAFAILLFCLLCFFSGGNRVENSDVIKALKLRSEVAGIRSDQTFDLDQVRNLRPIDVLDALLHKRDRVRLIAFDHDREIYRFGLGLTEFEAKRIVRTIRSKYPVKDDGDDAIDVLPIEI